MLGVLFSSMTTARAAMNVLEAYGYSAMQFGRKVVTDCPTLLAVQAIQKRLGFAEIERIDLSRGADPLESTAQFCPPPSPPRAEPSSQAIA